MPRPFSCCRRWRCGWRGGKRSSPAQPPAVTPGLDPRALYLPSAQQVKGPRVKPEGDDPVWCRVRWSIHRVQEAPPSEVRQLLVRIIGLVLGDARHSLAGLHLLVVPVKGVSGWAI